jgi:membrane fusion protein, peptide pheromone/bacteriocin exporter
MQDRLLPSTALEESLEGHLHRHSRMGRVLYLTLLALLAAAATLLPLVSVDVTVRSAGVIRPLEEKHEIRSRTDGVVERVTVGRGATVEVGDTLIMLADGAIVQRSSFVDQRKRDVRSKIGDLEALTASIGSDAAVSRPPLEPQLRHELRMLRQELGENGTRLARGLAELDRARELRRLQLASLAEVEALEFTLGELRHTRDYITARYLNQWSTELTSARLELQQLGREAALLARELDQQVAVASVAGTVEHLAPVSPGSFVGGGEVLAVISPSAPLVVEIFVTPREIGLLHVGMSVRLHVDAFNSRDWGYLTGSITTISDDYVLVDGGPRFLVRADLAHSTLRLPSGRESALRKGMTLTAHFEVTQRTLLQLLRDRLHDWLDPRAPPDQSTAAAP